MHLQKNGELGRHRDRRDMALAAKCLLFFIGLHCLSIKDLPSLLSAYFLPNLETLQDQQDMHSSMQTASAGNFSRLMAQVSLRT